MRATLIAAAVFLALAAHAAGPDSPFDRNDISVDDFDFQLLTENGYSFDGEGMLRSANRMTVSREDAAFLLENLRSRRRLAGLMEIKLILDRTAAQGAMTREDKAALRRIGQRDWPILGKSAKEQLKEVFSDKELYELNARSPKAPLPDASVIAPPDVRASQAHPAVPLDQPLRTFAGTLMPLAATAPAPAPARAPALPPAVPSTPAPAPSPAAVAAPAPAIAPAPVAPPPVPVAPSPLPVAPPTAPVAASATPVAPTPAPEGVPADIKPLPAPWANEPPTPAAATEAAPAPAPVTPDPSSVLAAVPAPPALPATPAVPPTAPAVPSAPDAPAPRPSEDELDSAPIEPAKAGAPPPPAGLAGFDAAPLPAAVTAALSAAPTSPPPHVAAVLPAAPLVPLPPGGFRVEAPAPPPARQAEGLSPAALPKTASPAPPAPSPPPVVEGPPYPPVTPDAFSAFLAQAPYGREEKALLAMVSANLPEPERTRALGVLMKRLPHVVLDSRRAGTDARASVTVTGAPGQAAVETVALHDGPVFRSAEAFLKADRVWLLPDEPSFYTARGLPVPTAAAFSRLSASAGEQATKWGRVRVYPDGSKRLSRSETALAGALTRALLLLDARARVPGDAIGAELSARVGEFRLYQALEQAAGKEPPLDKETLALYNEWRDRPLDFVDTMAHGFFALGAGARIAGEAGLGAGREPLSPPAPLPAAGSPAETAWLESERLAREKAQ